MISVLIPTYNNATFLPDTLSRVFAQTVYVDEVVLVDDGSTDDTPAIVQSLLAQHPDWAARLQYIRQEDQGKSVALNNGLKLARGEWLAFQDSDGTWLPEKLEMQFRALTEFPECRVCFTESSLGEFQRARFEAGSQTISANGPFGKVVEPSWLYLDQWPGTYMQSVVVHRDLLRDCGDCDGRLRVDQDVDFLFRLGLLTPFCHVTLPLVKIHRDPNRLVGLTTTYRYGSLFRIAEHETRLRKWASIDSFVGLALWVGFLAVEFPKDLQADYCFSPTMRLPRIFWVVAVMHNVTETAVNGFFLSVPTFLRSLFAIQSTRCRKGQSFCVPARGGECAAATDRSRTAISERMPGFRNRS